MSKEGKKQNESLIKKRPDYSPQRMKQISAAAYQIFMNAPDEEGNPQNKYQQFALGALQGFQDIGRAGTEQELKYILLRMKEWYKDKETYDKQFQQQIEDLQKSELNCFFILYTGRKDIFKKRRKRKRRKKTLNEIINPNTVPNTPIEEKPKNAETAEPAPESQNQAEAPKTPKASSATVTAKQTVSTAKKQKSNYQPFQASANTYHYGSKQSKKSYAFSSPAFFSVSEEKIKPEEAKNKTSNTEPTKKQVHDFFFSEEPEFESLEPPAE